MHCSQPPGKGRSLLGLDANQFAGQQTVRLCATSVFNPRSAASRMVRDRTAKAAAVWRRRERPPSGSACSISVSTTSGGRGPRVASTNVSKPMAQLRLRTLASWSWNRRYIGEGVEGLLGGPCQGIGLGSSCQLSIQVRTSSVPRPLLWTLRRIS